MFLIFLVNKYINIKKKKKISESLLLNNILLIEYYQSLTNYFFN